MHLKVEVPLFIALMVTWVSGQDCGDSKLTENHGKFTSPNYPNRYDHRADCKWIITAPPDHFIEVEFKEFDVKNPFWVCDYDYVTVIYGGGRANDTFCNDNKPKPIRSVTNTLTIHLKSDHFYSNGVGFEAEYYIVDKDGQKVAGEEDYNDDDDDWEDESTGKKTKTAIGVPEKTEQSHGGISTGDDSKPTVVKPTEKPKSRKGRKGKKARKGKKGKKQRKSKEERRRERKLRKKRERDEKKALRKKNRKGGKNKKAKRASKRRPVRE